MTVAVSIVLYVLAILFAYIGGVLASRGEFAASGCSVGLTGVLFVAASILSAWG